MYTIHQFILKWHIMLKLFTNYNYQSYEIIMQLELYTGFSLICPKIKFYFNFQYIFDKCIGMCSRMKDYNVKCVLQTRHIFLHIYIYFFNGHHSLVRPLTQCIRQKTQHSLEMMHYIKINLQTKYIYTNICKYMNNHLSHNFIRL